MDVDLAVIGTVALEVGLQRLEQLERSAVGVQDLQAPLAGDQQAAAAPHRRRADLHVEPPGLHEALAAVQPMQPPTLDIEPVQTIGGGVPEGPLSQHALRVCGAPHRVQVATRLLLPT